MQPATHKTNLIFPSLCLNLSIPLKKNCEVKQKFLFPREGRSRIMAMILDVFIDKFAGFAKEEVVMVLGVKDEVQKLQKRMLMIQSLLEDAEKKKFEDSAINIWLSELKDVMYDADDIIDLCRIQGAQLLADQKKKPYKSTKPETKYMKTGDGLRTHPSTSGSPVCSNFSSAFSRFTSVPFHHKIGRRIKELNDRLNQINEERSQFQLEKSAISEIKISRVNTRQTSSMVDYAVEGREVEKASNELVKLLITGEHHEKCRLFAVTGMGGIGKTTLAQKVFNDPKTKIEFNQRIWVCVSQNYSETDMLQQVIREAEGHYGDAKTKSELLPILKDSVGRGGSLFLVLDDIWREDVWVDLLRVPLYNANIKVRILVTTRTVDVARKMGAAHIYPVTQLSVESGWEMLLRRIFSEGQEDLASSLREIGLQIVEKCAGLPLAIKAIAGVLASRDSSKEWNRVIRSDAWSMNKLPEDLTGALYLSYEDLPSHLKQCFLYCSLYPEDIMLFRRDLSRLWVAEGFVREHPNSSDLLLEEIAENYFNELVWRNLLLPDPFDDGGITSKMHDLYHSLAQFLSRDESSCGTTNLNNSTTLTKLRRISLADNRNTTEILDSVEEQGSSLRTLLASSNAELLLDYSRLKRLSHLRVLKMNGMHVRCLPDCIGDLVHLRYLDLDGTSITQIPESIERLTNLQFISLHLCSSLTTLPTGITRLLNLRCLGLLGTPLSFIPKGLGRLEKLNELRGFVVADNMDLVSSGLEELNSLKQLRRLSISKLGRAQSTRALILRELPYLSELYLFCSQTSTGTNMEEQIEKLFNELIPPQCLEELRIEGYFGIRYPNWMSTSSFGACLTFMTRLDLIDFTSCTQLPPLGQLPELRFLYIKNAKAVEKIGTEFLGGDVHETTRIAFPKLELLELCCMDSLDEWSFGTEVEACEEREQDASPRLKLLPCLQELSIKYCPLLKQLPQGLKHSGVKILSIKSAHSLTTIINLPTLRVLNVDDCQALSCVEKLDALQKLMLSNDHMESLPEWLLKFLQQCQLQNDNDDHFMLELHCNRAALQGCLEGGSLWEIIQYIPHVTAFEHYGRGGYLRYTKRPHTYDTNL